MATQLYETHRRYEPAAAEGVDDSAATSGTVDRATSVFLTARPRLIRIAYRVLGDVGEAEDVVQEVWIRWQRADRLVVQNPSAFLATTAHRLALNVAQTAWKRRETPSASGPEPAAGSANPQTVAETGQEIELAVRLLLERLTPSQRAAYVLREAFGYPYGEISETLHLEAAHARQLVRRAHLSVVGGRRHAVDHSRQRRLVEAFLGAAQVGDLGPLEEVLIEDMAS